MVFWQLTVNARDPALLANFWRQALEYQTAPPAEPNTTWHRNYRRRLAGAEEFTDRIFDHEGLRPPIWFQHAPGALPGDNGLHLDLYPTGRDDDLGWRERVELVESKVGTLIGLGASVVARRQREDASDPVYFVTMTDPEGNQFCVS